MFIIFGLMPIIKQLLDLVYGEMYNKTIIGFGFCDMQTYINVSVGVINLAFGLADNSYPDIDNSAYHKNSSNNCLLYFVRIYVLSIIYYRADKITLYAYIHRLRNARVLSDI